MFDLSNRVALITGASSGLGWRFAHVLADQGATVAVAARRIEHLKKLTGELEEKGATCFAIPCDVGDEKQIIHMVKAVLERFGKIDILVNNAGISKSAPATEISMTDYDAVMDINSRAVFLTARECAKPMIEANYGRIINVSSMYGLVAGKLFPAVNYHVSKGSVINMTRALAAEWAKCGVTVNALCPGFFASEMTEHLLEEEVFGQYVKNSCCMERLGHSDELDTALVFLAANGSSYITGQAIAVDGGWTCI